MEPLESSGMGISSSDSLSLESRVVLARPRVAAFRDFPKGCGRFAVLEHSMSSDSSESLGTKKTLDSENTTPEKNLNEGEPFNTIKTTEPKTIHEPYPSQRRFAFREFPPGCGRFAPKLDDGERRKLIASSKSRRLTNRFEEIRKGNTKKMKGKVQSGDNSMRRFTTNTIHVHTKAPAMSKIFDRETAGKRKTHDMQHDDPKHLVKKTARGDKYVSSVYGGVARSMSLDSRLQAERLLSTASRIHTFANKDVVARSKVREALRLFQAICRILLREEEAKPKDEHGFKRVDLISATLLKKKNKYVNDTGRSILGNVPGVEVGDEFHYRVELAIVGLHRPFQSGIDYVRKGSLILATSIVASGELDNMDSSDILTYSGQGGQPGRQRKQAEDQKLERGNLALKNSMDEGSPVRVIRGFKETTIFNKIVSTFIYDGFYLVERYWQEKGRHGKNVFMFQLRRVAGQPELACKEVQKSKVSKIRAGLCVADISQGKEKIPISAVNMIDKEIPPPFKYLTEMMFPSRYNPTPLNGCQCTDGCLDSTKCLCVVKNGGEMPFNFNGDIVCVKPLVYECGPSCKCPPSCYNRVSQHGIRFQLEIFKTESRGWGVRSLTSITSGSFICEYTGELLDDNEAEKKTGKDEYLFDIGNNYNDGALWNGLSNLIPPELQSGLHCETVEDVGFTIDALKYGNVGRFINHSCTPNLYAQNVLYDHDDKRIPHIMFFAAENIPPLQELTYHYNYKVDQVYDSDGKKKQKECYCGSHNCSGRLY